MHSRAGAGIESGSQPRLRPDLAYSSRTIALARLSGLDIVTMNGRHFQFRSKLFLLPACLPDCWFFTLSHGLCCSDGCSGSCTIYISSQPRAGFPLVFPVFPLCAILRQSSEYDDKRKLAAAAGAAGKTYQGKWNYWWDYNETGGMVHLQCVGRRQYVDAKVKHISHPQPYR